jgi:hypothetical protein
LQQLFDTWAMGKHPSALNAERGEALSGSPVPTERGVENGVIPPL